MLAKPNRTFLDKIYRNWIRTDIANGPNGVYTYKTSPGIIIADRQDSDPLFHTSFRKLNDNFYFIDKAVDECLKIGCDSIYIVTDYPTSFMFKKNCKDFVIFNTPSESLVVPIFVVSSLLIKNKPIPMMFAGFEYALKVGYSVSYFMKPNSFYITSPYGLYNPSKKEMMSDKGYKSVLWQHDQQSLLTGARLPAKLNTIDLLRLRKAYKDFLNSKKSFDLPDPESYLLPMVQKRQKNFYYDCFSMEGYIKFIKEREIQEVFSRNSPMKYLSNDEILKEEYYERFRKAKES